MLKEPGRGADCRDHDVRTESLDPLDFRGAAQHAQARFVRHHQLLHRRRIYLVDVSQVHETASADDVQQDRGIAEIKVCIHEQRGMAHAGHSHRRVYGDRRLSHTAFGGKDDGDLPALGPGRDHWRQSVAERRDRNIVAGEDKQGFES